MRLAPIYSQLADCLAVAGGLRSLLRFAQVEPELEAQTPDGLRQPIPGTHHAPARTRLASRFETGPAGRIVNALALEQQQSRSPDALHRLRPLAPAALIMATRLAKRLGRLPRARSKSRRVALSMRESSPDSCGRGSMDAAKPSPVNSLNSIVSPNVSCDMDACTARQQTRFAPPSLPSTACPLRHWVKASNPAETPSSMVVSLQRPLRFICSPRLAAWRSAKAKSACPWTSSSNAPPD